MTSIRLDHISKSFGATVALDDISLTVNAGELFFLLGPSGCGKSTLLRLIAGLHEPTRGRIDFNGIDVTALPTEKRNAVMCFQSYALWPHMSVRENVRFGLGVRGLDRAAQDRRIDEVLAMVRMIELAGRKPNQLSGGQQQRIALARALAVNPACLLLDEPLSNLDAKLRLEMRSEIRRICKAAGFTTIYVTHDQKEALSVADRIAVLDRGQVAQVGTPGDLYHRPASAFVAGFIGQTNLIEAHVIEQVGDRVRLRTPIGELLARDGRAVGTKPVTLSIRPEQMMLVNGAAPAAASSSGERNRLSGRAVETTFLGEASEHVIEIAGRRLRLIAAPPRFELPEQVDIEIDPRDVVLLPDVPTPPQDGELSAED